MKLSTFFTLHAAIAVGYALAFFLATGPLLAVYGITPTAGAMFMARWFGVGLLAIGLITWFARHVAETAAGRAVVAALAFSYGAGSVLAVSGTLGGPFNALGWIAVAFNSLLGVGFAYFLVAGRRRVPAR